MQVRTHHSNLVVFLVQIMEKNVAQRDDTLEFPPGADWEMAETVAFHERHASLQGIVRGDGKWIFGHDLADRGVGGILAGNDYASHQVALGKDSQQLSILKNGHGADVVLHHQLGNFERSLVRLGGYCDLVLEQITDQHLHLPWTRAGEPKRGGWRQGRPWDEGRKKFGPAAEYMSKMG
jgi:hypothetical protein